MVVTMITEMDAYAVRYLVVDGYVHDHCDYRDCLPPILWECTVYFGADDAHHAGGVAFREAARKQEQIAWTAATREVDDD